MAELEPHRVLPDQPGAMDLVFSSQKNIANVTILA